MKKTLPLLLLIFLSFACNKNKLTPACPLHLCTDIFTRIGMRFADKNGNPIVIENLSVIDLRTNKVVTHGVNNVLWVVGYYIIADDTDLSQFTTKGDDIQVSATNPATHQTKVTVFKIAGGCNCHVTKISGPEQVMFD
jgi:predicted nucleic acid binding AN1-type Zn finger protein